MRSKLSLLYCPKPQGITKGWFGSNTIYCQLAQNNNPGECVVGRRDRCSLSKIKPEYFQQYWNQSHVNTRNVNPSNGPDGEGGEETLQGK